MPNDPVIMSEEPKSIKLQIDDPTRKKAQVSVQKVEKKPGFLDKLISAFLGSDVNRSNMGQHILDDYAIPTGKRLLNNSIQSGLKKASEAAQIMIFNKVISQPGGPTDYTSFSKPEVAKPTVYKMADNVETFEFSSRDDAFKCLTYLKGRIQEYGSASVLDYYEYIGQPLDYNMSDRGWKDLSYATISSSSQRGFVIEFPRPIVLKKG